MSSMQMDEERITINEIHNLNSIKFVDMGATMIDRSKTSLFNELYNNGESLIVPMLIISYDGCNFLSLCAYDKNFQYFVKKVREVYLQEKDKPVPGYLDRHFIRVDDVSKKILLSDAILQTSNLCSYYNDIESYNEPLMSSDKEVFSFLPLLEYIISENLSNFGKKFCLEKKLKGYAPNGSYVLYGDIDGIKTIIPIHIKKDNNRYDIQVGNIFGDLNALSIKLSFNKTNISMISQVEPLGYVYLESFNYKEGNVINKKEIYISDKCILANSTIIKKSDTVPTLSQIDEEDDMEWFLTPWGAYLGFKDVEDKIDDYSRTIFKKFKYIGQNKQTFIILESAEKRFARTTIDLILVQDIVLDNMNKTMVGYNDGNIIYIGTSFYDDGAIGEYKERFANKHFYQVSSAIDFDGIDSTNLYPVKREYDVYGAGDLINNYIVKSIAKGE